MQENNKLKLFGTNYLGYIVILVITALSFLGLTFLLDGNFIYAISGALLTAILLLVYFVLPYTLLFNGSKAPVKTAMRRVLIYTSPIMFFVLMMPVVHWIQLYEVKDEIQAEFKKSVDSAKGIFVSYDDYSNKRITSYKKDLANANLSEQECNEKVSEIEKRLKPGFKSDAIKWMDNASKASFLNFLIYCNPFKIEEQINAWNANLNTLSKAKFEYEESMPEFEMPNANAVEAIKSLNNIRATYFKVKMPGAIAIVAGLVFYIILLLPYILKSAYVRKHHSSDDDYHDGFSGLDSGTRFIDKEEKNYPTFTLNL